MTRFIGNLAGMDSALVNRLAEFAGSRNAESADAFKWAATSPQNILLWNNLRTGAWTYHFPTEGEMRERMGRFPSEIANGQLQLAAFALHSIQDGLGAHAGIRELPGHLGSNLLESAGVGTSVDRVLGDQKFIRAALATLHTMSGGKMSRLTPAQINQLVDAILRECGGKFDFKIHRPVGIIYDGGGGRPFEPGLYPYHYYWDWTNIWDMFIGVEVTTVIIIGED